jgi:toxin ParE1/3/4
MQVEWNSEAIQDRNAIFDYIRADNHAAATRMDILFEQAAVLLKTCPWMGRPCAGKHVRQVVPHANYRMLYRIDEKSDTITIVAVFHVARLWPPVGS